MNPETIKHGEHRSTHSVEHWELYTGFFFSFFSKRLTSECVGGRDLFLIIQIIPGWGDQNLSPPPSNMMGQNAIPMCKSINLSHCHELISQKFKGLNWQTLNYSPHHPTIITYFLLIGGGVWKSRQKQEVATVNLSYGKDQHSLQSVIYPSVKAIPCNLSIIQKFW